MIERVALGLMFILLLLIFGLILSGQAARPPLIVSPAAPRLTSTAAATIQPKNCQTAIAYGLDAYQAAAAGLDNDQDGQACYGN